MLPTHAPVTLSFAQLVQFRTATRRKQITRGAGLAVLLSGGMYYTADVAWQRPLCILAGLLAVVAIILTWSGIFDWERQALKRARAEIAAITTNQAALTARYEQARNHWYTRTAASAAPWAVADLCAFEERAAVLQVAATAPPAHPPA